MIPRRSLVTRGVLGGVLGALATGNNVEASATAPIGGADVTDETVAKIVQAITGLRTEVQGLRSFAEIAPVRDAQLTYLRANGKLPDYIEVGTTIWFAVHDWHVRWLQPMSIGRDNQGRYTLILTQTTLIMRTDATASFMSL